MPLKPSDIKGTLWYQFKKTRDPKLGQAVTLQVLSFVCAALGVLVFIDTKLNEYDGIYNQSFLILACFSIIFNAFMDLRLDSWGSGLIKLFVGGGFLYLFSKFLF